MLKTRSDFKWEHEYYTYLLQQFEPIDLDHFYGHIRALCGSSLIFNKRNDIIINICSSNCKQLFDRLCEEKFIDPGYCSNIFQFVGDYRRIGVQYTIKSYRDPVNLLRLKVLESKLDFISNMLSYAPPSETGSHSLNTEFIKAKEHFEQLAKGQISRDQ